MVLLVMHFTCLSCTVHCFGKDVTSPEIATDINCWVDDSVAPAPPSVEFALVILVALSGVFVASLTRESTAYARCGIGNVAANANGSFAVRVLGLLDATERGGLVVLVAVCDVLAL